jgi:chaperonin cofactor prefoldin
MSCKEADRLVAMTLHVQLLENQRERDRSKITKLQENLQTITMDASRYKTLRIEADQCYVAQLRANDEIQTQLDECRHACVKMREEIELIRKENNVQQHTRVFTKNSKENKEVEEYAKSILAYSTMSEHMYDYCRTPKELIALYFHNIGYSINDIDEARIIQAMDSL